MVQCTPLSSFVKPLPYSCYKTHLFEYPRVVGIVIVSKEDNAFFSVWKRMIANPFDALVALSRTAHSLPPSKGRQRKEVGVGNTTI